MKKKQRTEKTIHFIGNGPYNWIEIEVDASTGKTLKFENTVITPEKTTEKGRNRKKK